MRTSLWALVVFLVASSATIAQDPSVSAERLERLERAMQQLQQRNAELEEKVRRLEAQRPSSQAGRPAKTGGTLETEPVNAHTELTQPVFVSRAASEFKLVLGGFIQTQLEVGDVSAFEGRFEPGSPFIFAAPEVKDRFRVRRSRLNVSGEYAEQFEFKLEGEFQLTAASNSLRTSFAATDLFVNWHPHRELSIKVGQFKAPFGLEQLTSDSRLLSIEPSLATTALAPDRQIGIQISGQPLANLWPERADLLTYYAGIFNGTGRNISVNDNSEFMYVGRLEILALQSQILNQETIVRVGFNGLTSRDEGGAVISPALFVNDDGTLSPFGFPTAGGRDAYGFDLSVRLGRFDFAGEYLNQRVFSREVAGSTPRWRNFRPEGYYLQGSYFLVPDKLQLLTKWESLDPGQLPDDEIHSITAGLNYYLRGDHIKILANYIHTWSDFRKRNPAFGRAEFDEVILRLQVMF